MQIGLSVKAPHTIWATPRYTLVLTWICKISSRAALWNRLEGNTEQSKEFKELSHPLTCDMNNTEHKRKLAGDLLTWFTIPLISAAYIALLNDPGCWAEWPITNLREPKSPIFVLHNGSVILLWVILRIRSSLRDKTDSSTSLIVSSFTLGCTESYAAISYSSI